MSRSLCEMVSNFEQCLRSFAGAKGDISSSARESRFSRSYRLTATSLPLSATPVTHGNQPLKYTK